MTRIVALLLTVYLQAWGIMLAWPPVAATFDLPTIGYAGSVGVCLILAILRATITITTKD